MQYYEDREALLHYYVQPSVVEEVPPTLTTAQFVAECERDPVAATKGGLYTAPSPLTAEATSFLASTDRLLLLLGEAGSGKSMFTWLTAVDHMAAFEGLASSVGGSSVRPASKTSEEAATSHPTHVWIPVVIDLKHYRTSELLGLLPRALQVGVVCVPEASTLWCCAGDASPPHPCSSLIKTSFLVWIGVDGGGVGGLAMEEQTPALIREPPQTVV